MCIYVYVYMSMYIYTHKHTLEKFASAWISKERIVYKVSCWQYQIEGWIDKPKVQ